MKPNVSDVLPEAIREHRGLNRRKQPHLINRKVNEMTKIQIPVPIALLALLAASVAALVSQLPEIRRYLKVRSMS